MQISNYGIKNDVYERNYDVKLFPTYNKYVAVDFDTIYVKHGTFLFITVCLLNIVENIPTEWESIQYEYFFLLS